MAVPRGHRHVLAVAGWHRQPVGLRARDAWHRCVQEQGLGDGTDGEMPRSSRGGRGRGTPWVQFHSKVTRTSSG